MPSATAEALHEPQSPMPVMMTSQSVVISLTRSSDAGAAKLILVRAMVALAPCSATRSRPTSSRNGAAFCLVLTSRPTVAPRRSRRRGARGALVLVAVAVVPVGSRMGYGISLRSLLVLVHDDAAEVLAVHHVLVALVDLVQGVALTDQLGQLDVAGLPQAQDHRDVVQRVGPAEQRALHPAVVADEDATGQHHVVVADAGDDDRARLAGQVDGRLDHLVVHLADGADHRVRELAAGQVDDGFLSLLRACERVRGAELHRLLALVLHRVDRDDVLAAGVPGALHGVDAHPARTEDHHGLAGADIAGFGRGTAPGGHPAADQRCQLERAGLLDL